MEACYNSCQTCKFSMDHHMMLQCCHPKRGKTMAYDINACRSMDEKYENGFMLQEQSNYCVETSWWCKEFSAQDIDNDPSDYGGGNKAASERYIKRMREQAGPEPKETEGDRRERLRKKKGPNPKYGGGSVGGAAAGGGT